MYATESILLEANETYIPQPLFSVAFSLLDTLCPQSRMRMPHREPDKTAYSTPNQPLIPIANPPLVMTQSRQCVGLSDSQKYSECWPWVCGQMLWRVLPAAIAPLRSLIHHQCDRLSANADLGSMVCLERQYITYLPLSC